MAHSASDLQNRWPDQCTGSDLPCLIVRQATPFHVIGIVGQFDLHFMIDTAFCPLAFSIRRTSSRVSGSSLFYWSDLVFAHPPGYSRSFPSEMLRESFPLHSSCVPFFRIHPIFLRSEQPIHISYTPPPCDIIQRYYATLSEKIKNIFAMIISVFAVIGKALHTRFHLLPYSLRMASIDTTHCFPNLQTSTPSTNLPYEIALRRVLSFSPHNSYARFEENTFR